MTKYQMYLKRMKNFLASDADYVTDSAGCVNCTQLVESTLAESEWDEVMDDDSHVAWDAAVDAADWFEKE